MNDNQLLMRVRVSVDKDNLLGRIAVIEKEAERLRMDAMQLREAITCSQCDEGEERPEAKNSGSQC